MQIKEISPFMLMLLLLYVVSLKHEEKGKWLMFAKQICGWERIMEMRIGENLLIMKTSGFSSETGR
jgi:hypothetical protein